jgi:hypothetical protein
LISVELPLLLIEKAFHAQRRIWQARIIVPEDREIRRASFRRRGAIAYFYWDRFFLDGEAYRMDQRLD